MFDDYCKNFESGYCEKVDMNVPRSWCFNVCKGDWKGNINADGDTEQVIIRPKPVEKQSLIDLAHGAFGAAKRAVKTGFKMVDERTFVERMMCCTTCGNGTRCPYCGCLLKLKDRLASERSCPNPDTYPRLKKYPPRNYWRVTEQTTTAIICARNEPKENIVRTIESLRDNATGKLEIFVVLDGYDLQLEDCFVIVNSEPLGLHQSINKAAKESNGDYIFYCDAHCTMSEGWDTKLKCACDENTIAISLIHALDENWQYRKENSYDFVYLNSDLQEKWWGDYLAKLKEPKLIEETMALTGCGWMIRKDFLESIGWMDERFGQYGYTGPYLALSAWCNEGKVVLRRDVICGHQFGTNEKGRLYNAPMAKIDIFKNLMYHKFGSKIDQLFEKFKPPGWYQSNKLITAIRCVDSSLCDEKIIDYFEKTLHEHGNIQVKNVIRKSKTRPQTPYKTYLEMLLTGLNQIDSDYVFITEQDILYSPEHFVFVPDKSDVLYFDMNNYWLDEKGYFRTALKLTDMCVANRMFLIKTITESLSNSKKNDISQINTEYYVADRPSIKIRHDNNLIDTNVTKARIKNISPWGDYKKLWDKILKGKEQ